MLALLKRALKWLSGPLWTRLLVNTRSHVALGRNSHLTIKTERLCFHFLFPVGIVCTMASLKFAFVNYTTAQPAQGPVFMPLHSLLRYTVDIFWTKTLTFIVRCQIFFRPWVSPGYVLLQTIHPSNWEHSKHVIHSVPQPTSLASSTFSKYTNANPLERRDCWSYTMETSAIGPYLEKTSLRSLSVVYRLNPNTPRQQFGSGFA